jgi:hypothetical protein
VADSTAALLPQRLPLLLLLLLLLAAVIFQDQRRAGMAANPTASIMWCTTTTVLFFGAGPKLLLLQQHCDLQGLHLQPRVQPSPPCLVPGRMVTEYVPIELHKHRTMPVVLNI